ncbi:hypothetical protein [uncultured Sphingomonas sp.]|uniref:hypothetical protein n=1 Tax=uncultured Sphingomonas sp. TaxID=158754 RepID=UPI00259A5D36|nr:hypothetical protein [uncultured Sphingomonas sp.]
MKTIFGIVAAGLLSGSALCSPTSKISWFLYDEERGAWCGFTSEAAFQDKANKEKPLASARVKLVSGTPSEITYQVQPESGDWVIADRYSFLPGRISLKRATIFAQTGMQVIQRAIIRRGVATRLQLLSVRNVDGSSAGIKDVDVPLVPFKEDASQFHFLPIALALAKRPAMMLCGPRGTP